MKKNLGRGLSFLMGNEQEDLNNIQNDRSKNGVTLLPINEIVPNPNQPRKHFDEKSIEELSHSIKRRGVISPILVTKKNNSYEIIAGERRFKAAQKAKLSKIPAIIEEFKDIDAFEVAIIENIQRQDLNTVEEAKAYKELINKYSHSQNDLAKILGKSRSHITNILRILSLPETVLSLVEKGKITMGHARALIGNQDAEKIAEEIVKNNLSVRAVEALLKKKIQKKTDTIRSHSATGDINEIEELLTAKLKTKVKIKTQSEQIGMLKIQYNSLEKLDEILQLLSKNF